MTILLDQAIASLRALPPEVQDEAARMLLQWAGEEQPAVVLTPEEEASFAESLAEAASGMFASDDAVRAVWAKHDL